MISACVDCLRLSTSTIAEAGEADSVITTGIQSFECGCLAPTVWGGNGVSGLIFPSGRAALSIVPRNNL